MKKFAAIAFVVALIAGGSGYLTFFASPAQAQCEMSGCR
jgi:hypothetical protein